MGSPRWIRKDVFVHEHPRFLEVSGAALIVADAAWRMGRAYGCYDGDITGKWCAPLLAKYARLSDWPIELGGPSMGGKIVRHGMEECVHVGAIQLTNGRVIIRDFEQYQPDPTAAARMKRWRGAQGVTVTQRNARNGASRDVTHRCVTHTGTGTETEQDIYPVTVTQRNARNGASRDVTRRDIPGAVNPAVTAAVNGILACRQAHNPSDPLLVRTDHLHKWGPDLGQWLESNGAPDARRIEAVCAWAAEGQSRQARFRRALITRPAKLVEWFGPAEGDMLADGHGPKPATPDPDPEQSKRAEAESELRFAKAEMRRCRQQDRDDCSIELITLKQAAKRYAETR